MKHLKLYEEYTSNLDHPGFFKTYEEIENWLEEMGVEDYTINDDLSVDVDGDVYLTGKELKYIPVQFGNVNGYFDCSDNQLTSLTGCPSYVGEDFDCSSNQLTSLTGSPSEVDGSFSCSINQLTSLEGGPSKVNLDYYCTNNQLTSLIGFPNFIGWGVSCSDNYLTSLEGVPSGIKGVLNCDNNYLTVDKLYYIDENNPGYKEKNLTKISQNFLDKLETSELDYTTKIRILDSLKENKPQVYSELGKLVDLDDWLAKLINSEEHKDIIDL